MFLTASSCLSFSLFVFLFVCLAVQPCLTISLSFYAIVSEYQSVCLPQIKRQTDGLKEAKTKEDKTERWIKKEIERVGRKDKKTGRQEEKVAETVKRDRKEERER